MLGLGVLPACSRAAPSSDFSPVPAVAPPDAGPLSFPVQQRELLRERPLTESQMIAPPYRKGSGGRPFKRSRGVRIIKGQ
ncbi:MAG: hypothetical protein ACYDCL_12400 [Myxococcales bacterium]